MEIATESQLTLYTVSQFSERRRFISEGGLRFQIFNATRNGLEKIGAVVRIGRHVLIDEIKYFRWVDSQQKGNANLKGGLV